MAASQSAGLAFEDRLFESRTRVPSDPPPGNYVVIDVTYFSTTVVELLANGARCVHVTDQRGEEFAYRDAHPDAVIGGDSTATYEPTEGYDFFNSPSYVQSVDVAGRPVSMTSTNGGRAVSTLRQSGGDDVDVYVGTTTNAAAVARHLRADDAPTYLVSAGTEGDRAAEDHVGAALVDRYLDGAPPTTDELEAYCDTLEVARGPDYVDKHEVRRADVMDYVLAVNSRSAVPKLVGDRLVDATRGDTPTSAGAQATPRGGRDGDAASTWQ